ncbi:hypothetical protein GCM10028818_33220 [Spirosoma horti]
MSVLIPVSTGGQGLPVESARALYDFLGFDGSQWNRWAKKNIVNNPYALQGVDWEVSDTMSKTSEGGRPSVDYRLTIDFAKRLSMLARTPKGEEIRQYFLDCEATQSPGQLQMARRLASLEKMVSQLMDREQLRLQTDPAAYPLPVTVETYRAKVARLVTQYAEHTQAVYYVVWNRVYDRLHLHYGFNVRAQRKSNYENLLDVAERCGQMERLYTIVSTEFTIEKE